MPKEEESVPVCTGLGDVEVAPDEWDEERVKQVVEKLIEYLNALVLVRLRAFLPTKTWWREPLYVQHLPILVSIWYLSYLFIFST